MPDLDIIAQYLISVGPAITSLLGVVATVLIAVSKIKGAMKGTITEVQTISRTQTSKLDALETKVAYQQGLLTTVFQENVELKKQLNKVLAKLDHMKIVEK